MGQKRDVTSGGEMELRVVGVGLLVILYTVVSDDVGDRTAI